MYTVTRVFKFITIFVFYRKWKIIQHLVIFHRLFCFDKFVLQVFFDINLLYTNEMPQMYFEMEGQCDTLDVHSTVESFIKHTLFLHNNKIQKFKIMKAATSETICTLYITATRQYFKVNFLMLIFQPKLIDLLYLKSMYWSVSSSIFVVLFIMSVLFCFCQH